MKKRFSITFLIFLILLLSVVLGILFTFPSKRIGPTAPLVGQEIPLVIGVYELDDVEFFNKYAKENDCVSVRPQGIDLLDDVKIGEKSLIFGKRDDPGEMIQLALTKGIKIIGYNLEEPLSKEELVAKEKEVYELAKENGLSYIFGPTVFNLEKYYADFAQHADIILLQSQRYQTQDNYEEVVEELIEKIKSANPKVKVWVQVSVNPPGEREIAADKVIQNAQAIQDKADGIFIFYMKERTSVMEEVFKKLRRL